MRTHIQPWAAGSFGRLSVDEANDAVMLKLWTIVKPEIDLTRVEREDSSRLADGSQPIPRGETVLNIDWDRD